MFLLSILFIYFCLLYSITAFSLRGSIQYPAVGYRGCRNDLHPLPLVGAQGYERFPLSKSVVGQNIALPAVFTTAFVFAIRPSTPRWGTADEEIYPLPSSSPLVGARGYQRFPLSKSVVAPNLALHAVPAYRASTYLVSAFPAHSTSFPPDFSGI